MKGLCEKCIYIPSECKAKNIRIENVNGENWVTNCENFVDIDDFNHAKNINDMTQYDKIKIGIGFIIWVSLIVAIISFIISNLI